MTFYDMTWLERLLFLKRIKGGSGHEETTTSSAFVTDMVAPLRKLLLSFAPKQSGSGDPSPDNIRPISGWDGVSVVRSGKNLFDKNDTPYRNNYYLNVDRTVIGDSSIGTTSNSNYAIYKVRVQPNAEYTFGPLKANDPGFAFATESGVFTRAEKNQGGTDGRSVTVTTSADERWLFLSVGKAGTYENKDILQIEVGSTATAYEPYAGQTYSVSWQTEAGTVYGGTIDVASGVLTVDRAITTSPSWSLRDAGSSAPWIRISGLSYPWDSADRATCRSGFVCNKARTAANSGSNVPEEAFNYGIWAYDASVVRIYLPSGSVSADATAFMTDCQICYKLATPQTYQLTPQEIKTLIGTNVITTDANVEEIIYLKKAE